MTQDLEEESLVSHEMNDIISRKPHWVVRNGIFLFLLLLVGAVVAARLIKYPEMVVAQFVIRAGEARGQDRVYFAELSVPQASFGRLSEGQEVLLKLDGYPYQENGMLRLALERLDSLVVNGRYILRAQLPAEPLTTHGKKVVYMAGMTGQGEIILGRRTLLDRIREGK